MTIHVYIRGYDYLYRATLLTPNLTSCWPNFCQLSLLLAHVAKGNVSFCHHLASVVCRPLTFHILIFSSEIP